MSNEQIQKNYFYSELEDQIIVNSIRSEFEQRQLDRKPYEAIWELNMNFYLGNQYSYISSTGSLLDIERNFSWENREVYNHIAPIIETRLAKLNKIRPNFSIKPTSSSDKDLYSARLSKSILSNALTENNFNDVMLSATQWSEITGTSFYKITWDNDKGTILGKIDEKIINSGDVKITACSPFEIYPDTSEASDLSDCKSIIYAKALPISEIKEAYGIEVEGDDINTLEPVSESYISGITGRSNVSKLTHITKSGYAYLIERYEKPSSNRKNGRLTIICEDKLLFDGDLPYKTGKNEEFNYPFVRQISNRGLASFWGTSVIERCIPIQRAFNTLKNKKHEYISRLASGILTVEDGSVDVDNLEDEGLAPGKILIYRNGSTPPKFMSPGTIPSELEKEEDSLLIELNALSGIGDVSTSASIPSNISSGSAISLLIEQDESRLSLTAENIRNSITQVAEFVLRLFKQFASTTRISKITNSTGGLEIYYWSNNDLTNENVILDQDNELQENSKEKQDTLMSLYEKGLLNNSEGKLSAYAKKQLFTLLGVDNFELEVELDDIHKEKAQTENINLENIEEPSELDDHQLHITEHTKYYLTANDLSQKLKDKLFKHIEKHKNLQNI